MRASNTAELVFDDVRIPSENVVGKPGESTVHMIRNLEIERIALAAMAVGISRRCLSIMNQYASEREAFEEEDQGFRPDPEAHSGVMGRVQGNEGLCLRHCPEHEVV